MHTLPPSPPSCALLLSLRLCSVLFITHRYYRCLPSSLNCLLPPSSSSATTTTTAAFLSGRDIEVRTVDSGTLVQKIDLPKAKFICQGAAVYIASPSNCWRLEAVPLSYQIRDLLALEEFEEALNLYELHYPTGLSYLERALIGVPRSTRNGCLRHHTTSVLSWPVAS